MTKEVLNTVHALGSPSMVIDGSLERSWPQDDHLMDTFWIGPPLGAGEGFKALNLNSPALFLNS